MKTFFTIILLFAASLQSYCPDFDFDWLKKGIDMQKEISANEVKIAKLRAMDRKILKITAVIRHVESRGNYHKPGGSGEYGAYQYMPKTWAKLCHRYAGKYLKPTKENQDFIAYKNVEHLVKKGYTISQIASIWNSGYPNCTKVGFTKTGIPFNVLAYRRDFVRLYNKIKI